MDQDGASTSHQRQMQTRQKVKRKNKEAEEALKRKRENKRRANAFQRHDNIIRPNDIISDPQLGKIKLETSEPDSSHATVKEETESSNPWKGDLEMVECEVRIVKIEVDIPNNREREGSSFADDADDGKSSESSFLEQVTSSPPNENCLDVERSEVRRLGKTVAIRNSKIKELTSKVSMLEIQLAVSTTEKDNMQEQLLKKDQEIINLKSLVREMEAAKPVDIDNENDECNSCPPSPPPPSPPQPGRRNVPQATGGYSRPLRFPLPETENMEKVNEYLNEHEREFDERVFTHFGKVFSLILDYWTPNRTCIYYTKRGILSEPEGWGDRVQKQIIQTSRAVCKSWKQSVDRFLEQDPSHHTLCPLQETDLLLYKSRCAPRSLMLCNLNGGKPQSGWIRNMTRKKNSNSSYNPLPTRYLWLEMHLSHSDKKVKIMREKSFSSLVTSYLEQFGAQVWYLTIEISKHGDAVLQVSALKKSLLKWLLLVPNIRSLTIFNNALDFSNISELESLQFKNLITLQCFNDDELAYSIMKRTKTIQNIYLAHTNFSTPAPIVELDMPKLTELACYITYPSQDWKSFVESSWKLGKLKVQLESTNTKKKLLEQSDANLENLENFRSSLRSLTLEMSSDELQHCLNLPLLTHLHFVFDNLEPVKWNNILPKMKNLSVFQVEHVSGFHYEFVRKRNPYMIKAFWQYTHDMRRAKYWTNLPNLTNVKLVVSCHVNWDGRRPPPCETDILITRPNMLPIKFHYTKFHYKK